MLHRPPLVLKVEARVQLHLPMEAEAHPRPGAETEVELRLLEIERVPPEIIISIANRHVLKRREKIKKLQIVNLQRMHSAIMSEIIRNNALLLGASETSISMRRTSNRHV